MFLFLITAHQYSCYPYKWYEHFSKNCLSCNINTSLIIFAILLQKQIISPQIKTLLIHTTSSDFIIVLNKNLFGFLCFRAQSHHKRCRWLGETILQISRGRCVGILLYYYRKKKRPRNVTCCTRWNKLELTRTTGWLSLSELWDK